MIIDSQAVKEAQNEVLTLIVQKEPAHKDKIKIRPSQLDIVRESGRTGLYRGSTLLKDYLSEDIEEIYWASEDYSD